MYDYLFMLGLNLIPVSERGPSITQEEKYVLKIKFMYIGCYQISLGQTILQI